MFSTLAFVLFFIKVLLFPAYHSTDFDVHRNWLAICSKLPLEKWYYESTNPWTLDYPPFFAYFEWFLSRFVPKAVEQDGCLDLTAQSTYSLLTVLFQRSTVIVSELVLAYSLKYFINSPIPGLSKTKRQALALVLFASPAWLVLDHIHFQYNGMMYGILIFSFIEASRKNYLKCGFSFAVLLCFKHIYLYLAPAYFCFLLRAYILPPNANGRGLTLQLRHAVKLGTVVLLPFFVAFFPFRNHLGQVLSRLFPFSRGLTHAYWAPNVWAVYTFLDRVLGALRGNANAAATRGIVGNVEFTNLVNITPRITFWLTLFYQALSVVPVLIEPTYDRFIEASTLCGFASFMFGWHVHEKAVMLVIVPFTFMALNSRKLLVYYMMLISAGYVCLLPLIITPGESVVKYAYTAGYLILVMCSLPPMAETGISKSGAFVWRPCTLYMLGFLIVLPVASLVPFMLPRLEFAGLMIISLYSSVGVMGSWLLLSFATFESSAIDGVAVKL